MVDQKLESYGISQKTMPRKRLLSVLRGVDKLASDVRHIASELRPAVLDLLGLQAAIEWQASAFQRLTKIQCDIEANDATVTLSIEHSTVLLRALQVLLNNVVKHARATRVAIRLIKDSGVVTLQVEDNGCGFSPEMPFSPSSLGLLGVRERVSNLGGNLSIQSQLNHGTKISITIRSCAST